MGLNVRIYNIISNGNYTIRYKSGNNPYPVETDSTFTLLGSYTPATTEITISGLTFDTHYWVKMTDTTTGRYIVQNIFTHDSKAFPCYDTICFSIDVICPTPTPTPTSTPTVTPSPTESPGDPAKCSEGMDVVFLLDYTGSMGEAIDNLKTSISSIVSTIVTESNNNYRLGLVLFDEFTSQTLSPYSAKVDYTSLPSSQRYINTGLGGRYQWITAVEMMQTNNQTSFTTQLNKLNTTNFPLGYGVGGPEPADMGIDLIGTENFVGTFRTGVSKLIVIITDNEPSGNDDTYNQTDIDFVNSLTPQLYAQNIRALLMTTYSSTVLDNLAIATNGVVSTGFTGSEIITAIEDICVENTTPTPTVTPTVTPTTTITTTPTSTTCSDDIVRTLSVAPRISKSLQTDELNDLVYVVAYSGITNTSLIYAITPNTSTITQVYSGLNHARYSTLNTTNNKLYVTGDQVIYVFDVSLGNFSLITTITGRASQTHAGGLVYNSATNKIYAHSSTGTTTSELTIIDGVTNAVTTTLTGLPFRNANNGLVNSEFMECVPGNNKIYITGNDASVKVFDCVSNTVTASILLPADYASVMTYKPSTNQLYAFFRHPGFEDGYSIINCTTNTIVSSHTSPSFDLTFSAKYNSQNDRIYAANYVNGICVIDTATNLITSTVTSNSVMSVELYEPTNTIYVSNTNTLDYGVYEICGEDVLM